MKQMTSAHTYWDTIYTTKNHEKVSWHQSQPTISLDWILNITNQNDAILDVGSGVSTLADNLLEKNYQHLSLLEISPMAIQTMKKRLENHLGQVHFYNENILTFQANTQFNLWHDRAVFHFLTHKKDQQTYLQKLKQHLKADGYFLLATFAPTGPKQCSELDIVRYDSNKITLLLGADFKLIKTTSEIHPHPDGSTQDFNYFLLQKT
ncbi:hypothetical protein BGC33_12240 [Bathymodiolus thermophilus thioautotrophic gill symbiont]|uniref:Methyltransferase domain-containing protein n=2 Tax=Bathymodiolus thermophilus thioautotrophic gill symbiont TaxID=2360 RepID=A0A1J5TVT9_9GAMM|nr:hypothetical protein BGC33_12240 [Bathymodiolus thermophilus thioautotrophic gill symbiont]